MGCGIYFLELARYFRIEYQSRMEIAISDVTVNNSAAQL